MSISICIASYGDDVWRRLALERAFPSAQMQGVEVLIEHQPKGTNASSRNAIAKRASGDFLIYLDADDQLGSGYAEGMRREQRRVSKRGEHFLFTPMVSYIRNERPQPARFIREIPLNQANWLVIGTMIERAFFLELGGFRDWPHGLEDWDLWSRAYKAGASVVKVRRAIYFAYWNRDSAHHRLMANKDEHIYWHQKVGHSNWPDRFDACSAEEDAAKRLLVDGRISGSIRMLAD